MHLAIGVPNIWYRASMVVPDTRVPGETLRLTGVTLPGLPSLVVGSNGHVAWGFTNTGGDWSDLVVIEPDRPSAGSLPDAVRAARFRHEGRPHRHLRWRIAAISESLDDLGPRHPSRSPRPRARAALGGARRRRCWPADVTAPENARTLEEALVAAAGLGIPAQNFVAGDRDGPDRLDDCRSDSAADWIRWLTPGVVGRRRAPLGWIRATSIVIVSAHREPGVGSAVDRECTSRRGRHARDGWRRRLRRRYSGAVDSRSIVGDRESYACRHAGRATRRQRTLSRTVAEPDARHADAGCGTGRFTAWRIPTTRRDDLDWPRRPRNPSHTGWFGRHARRFRARCLRR